MLKNIGDFDHILAQIWATVTIFGVNMGNDDHFLAKY
jgi:hypothetical protein